MEFEYLTAEKLAELTETQREFYFKQKKAHEDKIAKEAAEKLKQEAIDAAKEAVKEETQSQIDAAVKVVKDEYDVKLEKAQAEMARAKEAQNEMRGVKSIQEEIMEKLSTEEGEKTLKDFLSGRSKKLDIDIESKVVVKPTGATGSGVAPQFANLVGPGHDTWHARNAIPVFPTQSDLIKFIQFTVDPDATGFETVAENGQKPDLGYIPTVVDAPVRKIAGLLDVSDEFNSDVVGARAFWAYELPQAYLDAEDYQIFKGDGTGQNLLGVWEQADVQSFPQGTVTAGSNYIDKLVAAQTEIRKLKRNTTAAFISPVAYQELLINKDDENGYTYPIHFGNDNILRIGDLPIMWSNVFEDGEGVIGDFARGVAIFQREAMQIRYFEQNKDNVEKNITTIRLEGRIALPIYYPEAFKQLAFEATT